MGCADGQDEGPDGAGRAAAEVVRPHERIAGGELEQRDERKRQLRAARAVRDGSGGSGGSGRVETGLERTIAE